MTSSALEYLKSQVGSVILNERQKLRKCLALGRNLDVYLC